MGRVMAVGFGYLLGSLSFAGLTGSLLRRDPRVWGTGRLGAWNAARQWGFWIGLLIFLGDFAKGAAAAWLARRFFPESPTAQAAGLAAVAGHIWPVFFRFRGGKGLATSLGVLAVLDWRMMLLPLVAATAVLAMSCNIYRAALAGIVALPLWLLASRSGWSNLAFGGTLAMLLLFTHREHLRALPEQPSGNRRGDP